MEWKSIETAPEGIPVYVYVPYRKHTKDTKPLARRVGDIWRLIDNNKIIYPTHYMYVEPPK